MSAEMRPEEQRDPTAEEEAEAAAAEAAEIGGPAPDDPVEDPDRPLVESGEGEAEGFELAEAELVDNAEHGDEKRFPDRDAGNPEEPTDAAFGEADEEIPRDADEAIRREE